MFKSIKTKLQNASVKAITRNTYATALALSVLAVPNWVLAKDPTAAATGLVNKVINFCMVISPLLGTAALMLLAIMYKLTGEAHKKSDLRGQMKGVVGVVALVFMAGGIVKWVVDAVK